MELAFYFVRFDLRGYTSATGHDEHHMQPRSHEEVWKGEAL